MEKKCFIEEISSTSCNFETHKNSIQSILFRPDTISREMKPVRKTPSLRGKMRKK